MLININHGIKAKPGSCRNLGARSPSLDLAEDPIQPSASASWDLPPDPAQKDNGNRMLELFSLKVVLPVMIDRSLDPLDP